MPAKRKPDPKAGPRKAPASQPPLSAEEGRLNQNGHWVGDELLSGIGDSPIHRPSGAELVPASALSEIQHPAGAESHAPTGSYLADNETWTGFSPHLSWSRNRYLMRVNPATEVELRRKIERKRRLIEDRAAAAKETCQGKIQA